MKVGAIESPMFVVLQKIFFRTVGLLKKNFIVDGSHGPSHFSCVGFQSKFFENPKKKMFLMSKMDFHKKFEKSFHEMFLMITASFKTFDEFRRRFKERKKFQKLEGSAKDDFLFVFQF